MLSTVFNNQQRSGYDEMLSYSPNFYKQIREMDVNFRFAGSTLDTMAENMERVVADQFIDSMDEESIARMEKWLEIDMDTSKSIEDRRKKVKLFWNGGDKFCGSLIKSMVKSYTGCEETPSVRMTTHLTIMAQIKEENTVYISDLQELIERMKPAHILAEVLLVSTTKIKVRTMISHLLFPYDKCGEKPEIATHGSYLQTAMRMNNSERDIVYSHKKSNEQMEAGTFPEIATKGAFMESSVNVRSDVSDSVYGHLQSSEEQETGTYPNIATVGQASEDGLSISTSESLSVLSFVECGTNLCGEEGL